MALYRESTLVLMKVVAGLHCDGARIKANILALCCCDDVKNKSHIYSCFLLLLLLVVVVVVFLAAVVVVVVVVVAISRKASNCNCNTSDLLGTLCYFGRHQQCVRRRYREEHAPHICI